MFKEYSPLEYMMINACNYFHTDKILFEDRIKWIQDNAYNLRNMLHEADDYHLAYKALLGLERAMKGEPTGHVVHLDACSQGTQLLAVLSGCIKTASKVGLVDPNKRCNVYLDVMGDINKLLPESKHIKKGGKIDYDAMKYAFMCHWYSSVAKPKELLGEGTELQAFYETLETGFPGVWELFEDINGSRDPGATEYSWVLPDGAEIVVPIMVMDEKRIKIDELGSSITHRTYVNQANPFDCGLGAHTVHSVDGFTVREVTDRVSYNPRQVNYVRHILEKNNRCKDEALERLVNIAEESNYVTSRFINMVNHKNIGLLPDWVKEEIWTVSSDMIRWREAPCTTVHDSFGSLARAGNAVRWHYNRVLSQIARSDTMQFIFRGIHKDPLLEYEKYSDGIELSKLIMNSNYALS